MLEQVWQDNTDTAMGSLEHANVHHEHIERRGNTAKIYEMYVCSDELRLVGLCDCIEAEADPNGAYVEPLNGSYRLFPVEYKHGVKRDELEYNVQLCAQAMCLEEMFNCRIEEGAVFYITSHRRVTVELDEELRKLVCEGAYALEKMRRSMKIPTANYTVKCRKCSLQEQCAPKVRTSAEMYIKKLVAECSGSLSEFQEEGEEEA